LLLSPEMRQEPADIGEHEVANLRRRFFKTPMLGRRRRALRGICFKIVAAPFFSPNQLLTKPPVLRESGRFLWLEA
jgi:hypothetical protein